MQLFWGLSRINSMSTTRPEDPAEQAKSLIAVGTLPDAELEDRLKRLAAIERKALVLLLAHLGEFDQRRLHADRGHPSLFSYCMRVLGYSEQAAYKRIQAARAARAHPEILRRLAESGLTLTAVVILAPHLRIDNAIELLDAARGRRTREVEAIAARLAPRPDSPDCLRALPAPAESKSPPELELAQQAIAPPASDPVRTDDLSAPADEAGACAASVRPLSSNPTWRTEPRIDAPRELIEPLSAQRYLFRFTGSSALLAKYERARELSGSVKLGRSMETMFEAGLDALLARRDPERRIARRVTRAARRSAPRSASRRISLDLRDAVWKRDGGRCTFIGPDGKRCSSTSRLEIDHVQPYALGGASDDAANLRVLCRAHNQLLARRTFGSAAGPRHSGDLNYPQG